MLAHHTPYALHFSRDPLGAQVRWRKEPAHRLVLLKDVQRLTGLSPDTREELFRIPIALLSVPENQADEGDDTR
jgi:hypothetical protein